MMTQFVNENVVEEPEAHRKGVRPRNRLALGVVLDGCFSSRHQPALPPAKERQSYRQRQRVQPDCFLSAAVLCEWKVDLVPPRSHLDHSNPVEKLDWQARHETGQHVLW